MSLPLKGKPLLKLGLALLDVLELLVVVPLGLLPVLGTGRLTRWPRLLPREERDRPLPWMTSRGDG